MILDLAPVHFGSPVGVGSVIYPTGSGPRHRAVRSQMSNETMPPKKLRTVSPALIELSSNDPVTTRRFLESVFGWSFAPPPDSADDELAFHTPEGGEGLLHAARSYEPSTRINRVRVSDLGTTLERVQRAGATLLMPRVDAPGLGSFFTVEIPGGTLLTCWQTAPPVRRRNR